MRVDLKATRSMWRQTVYGSAIASVLIIGLIVYFSDSSPPDPDAARFAGILLMLMPVGLGITYLIRRLIERLAE